MKDTDPLGWLGDKHPLDLGAGEAPAEDVWLRTS